MVLTSLLIHRNLEHEEHKPRKIKLKSTSTNIYFPCCLSFTTIVINLFKRKKKKKINGRPLTPVLLQQSLSKPQTQPCPTIHNSSPPLQHHLRWWFSSSNLLLTGISILIRSQPKHLPFSLIFRNLKELKLPSSFKANPSHHHLSTSLLDLSEPNSQTHSSIYHSGVEALHNQTRARCRKSLTDLVADLVIPWVLGCCLVLKFSLYFYYTQQIK